VRLAEACGADALGEEHAHDKLTRARLGLAAMGVTESGWHTAFRLAAGLPS